MEKEMVEMRVQNIAPEPRNPSRKPKARKGKTLFIVCILAIPILNWLVFWLFVNISSILLAFQEQSVEGVIVWDRDFSNFVDFWKKITESGEELNLAFKNTALYFVNGLLITMPLSLLISYFLSKKIVGYQFFRIVFYLPCIITPVVLTSLYDQFLTMDGPMSVICKKLSIPYPELGPLNNDELATPTIILYTILTGFGGDMLIFSGAMSRIPTEIYESAKLDGCGPLREVVTIVVPLIWSTISTKIVLLMSGIFAASGPIMLLVNNQFNTITIAYWIFYYTSKEGYTAHHLVATAGLCFTLILLPIILGVRAIMDKFSDVEY